MYASNKSKMSERGKGPKKQSGQPDILSKLKVKKYVKVPSSTSQTEQDLKEPIQPQATMGFSIKTLKKPPKVTKKTKKEINSDELSVLNKYHMELRKACKFVPLTKNGAFAFPDYDNCNLSKQWIIVETIEKMELLVCSCKLGATQRSRLESLKTVSEDIDDLVLREQMSYCIHCQVCDIMRKQHVMDKCETETPVSDIDIVSVVPFVAVVMCYNLGYGVVSAGQRRFKCQTCTSAECDHLRTFVDWNSENGAHDFKIPADTVKTYSTVSQREIPWPLNQEQQKQFRTIKHDSYPKELEPDHVPKTCKHNIILTRFVICENAVIHREAVAEDGYAIFGYRTASGCCSIKYDGQEHLLLNVDNKSLVEYEWLFGILRRSQETQYPLQAALRSAKSLREDVCSTSIHTPYSLLHKAYNSFSRLLEWDSQKVFHCEKCELKVKTGGRLIIICDGIAMGCRRDLMPVLKNPVPEIKTPIEGSKHSSRVLLTAKTRKLLGQYVSLVRGRLVKQAELPGTEFKILLEKLKKECQPLFQWISTMGPVPDPRCRELFAAISTSSSLCGSFQLGGSDLVVQTLKSVCKGEIDITNSKNWEKLTLLQSRVPVLATVIKNFTTDGQVGEDLQKLVGLILERLERTEPVPGPENYSTAMENRMEYFPNFPTVLGSTMYKADNDSKAKSKSKAIESVPGECRKLSKRHPRLTPGLFTLFCEHGISQGFSLMTQVESPRTPFDIFTSRFTNILDNLVIIYDNSCNLHEFALNREAGRYGKTLFLVDRLHFRDHTACSQGYNLNTYRANIELNTTNSQANEQANAALRNLSKQVTFMGPEQVMHHTALFLAQRNIQKKREW